MRFGGSLETDFDKVSSFNFLFAHSWHLLNSWGAEWRNEIQIGERQRFLSEFYQPLGTTLPLFIQPSISFERQSYDIYGTEGKQAIARWRATQFDSQVLFGWEMARLGYAGISAGWISMRAKPEIGRDPPPQERYEAPYIGAHLFLDTLDNVSFPTKGYRLTAEGRTSDENIDGRGGTHVFKVNVLVPWSREKWTALLEAEIDRFRRFSARRREPHGGVALRTLVRIPSGIRALCAREKYFGIHAARGSCLGRRADGIRARLEQRDGRRPDERRARLA